MVCFGKTTASYGASLTLSWLGIGSVYIGVSTRAYHEKSIISDLSSWVLANIPSVWNVIFSGVQSTK